MTLQELRYIVAVDRFGHFGKAAEHCHISQPSLSIGLKKLEDELGISLFERSKHKVRATPSGQKIIAQAQLVLAQAERIKELADDAKDPLKETLRIGAIYTIGPYLFPHLLPQLKQLAPAMPLVIEESYTASLRRKLRDNEIDMILIALPFTEPDVVVKPLYEEPFVVLLPKGHELCQHEALEPEQLDNSDILLLGEGHCFRDQVIAACPHLQPRQDSILRDSNATSLDTIKHMVASGLGYTILPLSAAGPQGINSELLTIRPFAKPPTRTVALAWRNTFPRLAAVDAVSDAVTRCQVLS